MNLPVILGTGPSYDFTVVNSVGVFYVFASVEFLGAVSYKIVLAASVEFLGTVSYKIVLAAVKQKLDFSMFLLLWHLSGSLGWKAKSI